MIAVVLERHSHVAASAALVGTYLVVLQWAWIPEFVEVSESF